MKLNIKLDETPIGWDAYDEDRYDVDCDDEGYYFIGLRGSGKTQDEALAEFLQLVAEEGVKYFGEDE